MEILEQQTGDFVAPRTPLMKQYWEIKKDHSDKIVLFRMGDFYEMFHRDAEIAAPLLGIALTVRNRKSNDDTKMCGVPYHSIATPIAKLLNAGLKVALCEQMEDPALAKGLVQRAVTRILTPGMVYDPLTLDQSQGQFISAFDRTTVSFLETTTGEAFYYSINSLKECETLWSLIRPKELVLTSMQRQQLNQTLFHFNPHLTVEDSVNHTSVHSLENLQNASLDKNSLVYVSNSDNSNTPESALRLLSYAIKLQGSDFTAAISGWEMRKYSLTMQLSSTVVRHLELIETYKGDKKGSLLYAVDRTRSASGARLLKSWLQFPLTELSLIQKRLDQVQYWVERSESLQMVRSSMSMMGDVERRLGKISNPNCNPRDLIALAQSLKAGLSMKKVLPEELISKNQWAVAQRVLDLIEGSLVEDPPLQTKVGGIFKPGAVSELDELIELTENSKIKLIEFENKEKEVTGIGSLKARFNQVFGFYLEVTKTHLAKVPPHYLRKQTLAQVERYTTAELQDLEGRILSAQSRRQDLEMELFLQLRLNLLKSSVDLIELARLWSELDVLTSLAWLAIEFQYSRPQFGNDLELISSRHPVVEQESQHSFVPNDIQLKRGGCILLTGPNMAGKSTLMRQVAITAILAQMGSFVPAKKAVLPVYDRLFTRIGASDFLSEGLSTFMVEMTEVAEILKFATNKSLVVLDEVGRGTSTYDGVSLAQAILEFLMTGLRPMVFFATHYQELTFITSKLQNICNLHMAIKEKSGQIQFLHTLTSGPANKSYGIQVAQLAGISPEITRRARQLLDFHESGGKISALQPSLMDATLCENHESTNFPPNPQEAEIIEQLRNSSLQKMTPLEALNQLHIWQKKLV
ncbi:MAG: DNA mismatch repair protein MutS [Bdellovibrionales bacterium]|nr:DNA mismatch repair protein MutS [Bdellovibrionales bacterium]